MEFETSASQVAPYSSGLEENAARTTAKAERSEILHCLTERSAGSNATECF
jgi:hypothetical protein